MTDIRRITTMTEEVMLELGEPVVSPVRRAAAAAVVANPWAGAGVVADLGTAAAGIAADLAQELTRRLSDTLGGSPMIEAFGKGAIVGLAGEIEHGAALIHTPYFGNILRELVEGTSIIVFSDHVGPGGSSLSVPLWHKTASATRSHYQTMPISVPDAPRDDEIVVIATASSGPRPNARIGDRSTDPAVRLTDLEPTP
jgi:hypothetical protein